ncbi:MAG TPA: cytochrome C oxidase subunit IV family protein [Candidatus Kapabacteria bacterium]|nr:cytochrome C oxidase subunit IV family protein [Candidatus Kapabacteria bacterium]
MASHSAHSSSPSGSSHPAAAAHGHGHHDVGKEVRKYMLVFGALIIGTILTVAVSYIELHPHWKNIAIGLVIATVKAGLVAAFFMHLIDERKLIYGVLGATVFFFIGLMYLTLWSSEPSSFIHLKQKGAETQQTSQH